MIELRSFARAGKVEIPVWAVPLGAKRLASSDIPASFRSGFTLEVPLTDTTIYLDYLTARLRAARDEIESNIRFERLEEVSDEFDLVVNCAGIGAKALVPDPEVEPHRGQVVLIPRIATRHAIVCDDSPLMYAIPRSSDCLLGGTNDVSFDRNPDPAVSQQIVAECTRVLGMDSPKILATRVGLRPFRRTGVCLRADRLADGRRVIHNYGHGGSGFTLSWGCALEVLSHASR